MNGPTDAAITKENRAAHWGEGQDTPDARHSPPVSLGTPLPQ
jgi:hypothetical protein